MVLDEFNYAITVSVDFRFNHLDVVKSLTLDNEIDFVGYKVFSIEPNTIAPSGIANQSPNKTAPQGHFLSFNYLVTMGFQADITFTSEGLVQPSIDEPIDFQFTPDSGVVVEELVIYSGGFNAQLFGTSDVINFHTFSSPSSIASGLCGKPGIRNNTTYALAGGFRSSAVGTPGLLNLNKFLSHISGPANTAYGTALVYNSLQFLRAIGANSERHGGAFLLGGVKYLDPQSYNASIIGRPSLVNTTENQSLRPTGIGSASIVSSADVSPKTLYPTGFNSMRFGGVLVEKPPAILPNGINNVSLGSLFIWFYRREISPSGLYAYDTGHPDISDPSQEVQAPSLLESAIFGDIIAKNTRSVLRPTGFESFEMPDWAVLNNTKRCIRASGYAPEAYGLSSIVNNTPSVFVAPIGSGKSGKPSIGFWVRLIQTGGFDHMVFGRPTLTKTPELWPSQFIATLLGHPTASNSTRFITAGNIEQRQTSNHIAWHYARELRPKAWSSDAYGNHILTHGIRELIGRGFYRGGYGSPWVSYGQRTIEPVSVFTTYPSKHMVGQHREIMPDGYIATLFGTRIIPQSRQVYALGFSGLWGVADVGLRVRYIKPQGYLTVGQQPADKWGSHLAYNLVQYITQEHDGQGGLAPPRWPDWMLIENKNKQINASGHNSFRTGYTFIYNNAAPLLTLGIAPLPWDATNSGMVDYGLRPLQPEGIDAPSVSTWGVVYNAARVLAPIGYKNEYTGNAYIVNTRRYYSNIGRIESQEFGEPMVAFAIRYIDIEPRYSIDSPQINLPKIELWTRYLSFRGNEYAGYGAPSLSIHFNIIAPKWVHRINSGYPSAKNLTPEIGAYGKNTEEFGATSLRLQWRSLFAHGDTATLFGATRIADRKQRIEVRGWLDTIVTQRHTATRMGAPAYSEQRISLDGWQDFSKDKYVDGNGIYFDERLLGARIPKPGLNQNVIYTRGSASHKFGQPRTWSNNIQVIPGYAMQNVPNGASIHNQNMAIDLNETSPIDSSISFGKPRLSPHTIWAVKEGPAQAKTNHPAIGDLHYVGETSRVSAGVRYGEPKIESTIRSLLAQGYRYSSYGTATLTLIKKIVSPKSFTSVRLGIPSIPFTDQYLDVFSRGGISSTFGKPGVEVTDWGVKEILVRGLSSMAIGRATAELNTRFLSHSGHLSQAMGARRNNDTPYMWQGLRIGAHVPTEIGGGDTSLFGNGLITLYVRGLQADGFDSFISEYDGPAFKDRMTVKLKDVDTPELRRVTAHGFDAFSSHSMDVKFGQYFIRPDGNSDQFRKGAW